MSSKQSGGSSSRRQTDRQTAVFVCLAGGDKDQIKKRAHKEPRNTNRRRNKKIKAEGWSASYPFDESSFYCFGSIYLGFRRMVLGFIALFYYHLLSSGVWMSKKVDFICGFRGTLIVPRGKNSGSTAGYKGSVKKKEERLYSK